MGCNAGVPFSWYCLQSKYTPNPIAGNFHFQLTQKTLREQNNYANRNGFGEVLQGGSENPAPKPEPSTFTGLAPTDSAEDPEN